MTEPLFEKWRAQPNDRICDFLSEDIAEHVTELHNRTLS